MRCIEVVAGVFMKKNQVFCAQRKDYGLLALKWEFPGGKIEKDETNETALKRELLEELEIDSNIGEFYITVNHQYDTFHLTMHVYMCTGDLNKYKLNEHNNAKWVNINELLDLDWAEADIPIVNKLMEG